MCHASMQEVGLTAFVMVISVIVVSVVFGRKNTQGMSGQVCGAATAAAAAPIIAPTAPTASAPAAAKQPIAQDQQQQNRAGCLKFPSG
jgi:uncharacterized transporter YbjL